MTYAIGVAGAHRTGKSTLCRQFATITGVPFIETSASGTFRRLGFDPQAAYDLATRTLIQAEILADLSAIYKEAPPVFVTDRTPLDAAAYLLSEYNRSTLKEVADEQIMAYIDRCMNISTRYFGSYLIIQPGIPIVSDSSKAPALIGYMEHINSLVIGLGMSTFITHADITVMPRSMTMMNDRLQSLYNISGKLHAIMTYNSPVKQNLPA